MTKATKGVEFTVSELGGGDEELLPADTLGGIMQRISRVNAHARKDAARVAKCESTFSYGARTINTAFCSLDEGHAGDHVGYRKRWPNRKDATARPGTVALPGGASIPIVDQGGTSSSVGHAAASAAALAPRGRR